MFSSHINHGQGGSQVAHHRKMRQTHVGLWFLFSAAVTSTYAGGENLHWAFPNHATPWHCSSSHAPHGRNEGQLTLNLYQLKPNRGKPAHLVA